MSGIGTELLTFIYAVLTGIIVPVSYYILLAFRKLVRHSNLAAGMEDLIFWTIMSGYIFRQMYLTTYGSIRWYFILGMVLGITGTHFVGKRIKKLSAKVWKNLEKLKKRG